MRLTQADVRLWQWYKLPRFARDVVLCRAPSIHEAINARAGIRVPRAINNALTLLRLARSNYARGASPLFIDDSPNFRAYIEYLARSKDERRHYCARILRHLEKTK